MCVILNPIPEDL